MPSITLKIRARHFKGSRFSNPCNCPLSIAAKEQFTANYTSEGVVEILIGENEKNFSAYSHNLYGHVEFLEDSDKAEHASFDKTVIREVVLTPRL